MLTLFGFSLSGNVYKVKLLLAKLKQPFVHVEVNSLDGETASDDFARLNPLGKVPVVLFPDGSTLSESGAILYRLAQGTEYWPQDVDAQAQALRWMFWEQNVHEPVFAFNRYMLSIRKDLTGHLAKVRANHQTGAGLLAHMDAYLTENAWFAGETFSIADIMLYPYTATANEGGFDLTRYRHLTDWLHRFRQTPEFVLQDANIAEERMSWDEWQSRYLG